MTVTGGRTVYELRGISCLPLELIEPTRKGIAVTCSFGAPVTSWQPMREAIASYATRAAEKMRRYKVAAETSSCSCTRTPSTTIRSTRTALRPGSRKNTYDTREVVALAVRLGERLWRDGFRYSKCGVMITELLPETIRQPALWGEMDRDRRVQAWKVMDKLNAIPGAIPFVSSVPVPRMPPGSSERSSARLDGPRSGISCHECGHTDKAAMDTLR